MSDQSTADILREAKAHISDPAMWFKGGMSKHGVTGAIAGLPCCAAGACDWALSKHIGRDSYFEELIPYWELLNIVTPNGNSAAPFNDHPDTKHSDVMSLFDRAIAAAGASQ